ncbi:MAG: polysaccharide biosynthesis/export family protein [Gemmatimonadetes bacterium]|nr:polysaccharide biosynthesis/export family protein [Gemmatimonadota bacterium]
MLVTLLAASLLVAGQAPGTTADTASYVVGPEDVLLVTVFNEPQLSGKFRVETDGQFSYPFLGRVQAAGVTAVDIAQMLKTKLADGYLRNPQVTVDVDQFRSQSVFVMGEVRSPGRYTLSGQVTLLEALAQAGSTTAAAGGEVLILHPRETAKNMPAQPGDADADIERINLRDIESGKLSQNVPLHDGDTVFVPRAERFYVTGFVRNPGYYVLEPNMTVLQAISMAGGVTERGSNRRVRITRIVNNERSEFDADLTDIVQPGDTINVRQRIL